jgi:dihydroorotate dehydrogenase
LFCFDAESIHDFIVDAGKFAQKITPFNYAAKKIFRFDDERLHSKVFNIGFDNPVGLAAGFDKNAELVDLFYGLGFGFIEVGTLSAKPSKGADTPRIFRRVKEEALINSMGLPNAGIDSVISRLSKKRPYPVGVNIAQSTNGCIYADEMIEDVAYSFSKAAPLADYIALNISCPNVRAGKSFENPYALDDLLAELKKRNEKVSLLVKLSPDLSLHGLEEIISVCAMHSVDGYVISNTKRIQHNNAQKGLSGLPLQKASTDMIKKVYQLTNGKIPIIGVGGVDSAASAYEKISAGASLVQVYTGLIYQGPMVAKQINNGLLELMEKDGYSNIAHAVGKQA